MVSQLAFQTSLLQEETGELDSGQHNSLSFSLSLSLCRLPTTIEESKGKDLKSGPSLQTECQAG